ncbi:hypothetical protein Plhal304r1_c004g0015361 [Plasmopara halstedii]
MCWATSSLPFSPLTTFNRPLILHSFPSILCDVHMYESVVLHYLKCTKGS